MDLGIKNKKALVTGAGRGLGKAIVQSLAKEGVKVALVSKTKTSLLETFNSIGGNKNGHWFYAIDLTKEGAPQKTVINSLKEFGSPDVLVNNLGDSLNIKDPFCSISDWRKLWRINIEVGIEFCNLLIPHMQKQKWGRVVNISSIAALENQGPVPYSTIKAALNAYTRSMGRVVAADGVIMTSVLPGAIFTAGGYWDVTSKESPDHVKKYLHERMAVKRFGRPEELSSVVTFLCSQQVSFCVGSAVTVDGGQGRVFLN